MDAETLRGWLTSQLLQMEMTDDDDDEDSGELQTADGQVSS